MLPSFVNWFSSTKQIFLRGGGTEWNLLADVCAVEHYPTRLYDSELHLNHRLQLAVPLLEGGRMDVL